MGEKFAANPVTGTGSMTVPIATSPGRSGVGPQLSLSYDSGAGNGQFGFGWSLSLPAITRKTDKGLPQYLDAEDSDEFILSGAEDLVPEFEKDAAGQWILKDGKYIVYDKPRKVNGLIYNVRRYRPRIEGLFARIERWTSRSDPTDIIWRSISKDNITTWYGKTAQSRIQDPNDSARIFSWLICQSHDDKGNVVVYSYKPEDSARIFEDAAGNSLSKAHERNRTDDSRSAQRYLKRIRYGNRKPYLPELKENKPWPELPGGKDEEGSEYWLFEMVFDYGDHDTDAPKPNDDAVKNADGSLKYSWKARPDPFSSYRSGFEVRTYRLCQRALMFHHFPGERNVEKDCLVRSTDFNYEFEDDPTIARAPIYSFLTSGTQSGYVRQGNRYLKKSLPPVEFTYSKPEVQDLVEEVDPESVENVPIGLDGTAYQWTDLHGEGIPGILTEQGGAWFYKRNWSPLPDRLRDGSEVVKAKFSALETVALKPNSSLNGGAQFMDLAGDGQPDLAVMDGPMPGLYEHDEAEGWESFRPFTSRLNRNMQDPNLKIVDLDGDGHADVLITEDDAFVWHPSLAEEGFGAARRVHQALDEEKGPRVVFADGTQSISLADLSGDGLTDLVRIRNGEVCYWPNLGYGRFGAKVTMDNGPWFDNPDQFDQKRIRLADIDGSGTTDIIYLHRDGVRLYFNQSGNSWSTPQQMNLFPRIDDLVSIVAIDLLGNGTACLVWSSPLPGDARRPMRYVNLMGTHKPHLLIKTINNLGAETQVQYAPSTKFYLLDKQAGMPWITRLPFPVHVVEKVTVSDKWRNTCFSTTYSYHHGYFDGEEREFRGFGRVEQVDTEDYGKFSTDNAASPYITPDHKLYQPPVKTVTWYHTGAFLDRGRILSHFEHEYFPHWLEQRYPELKIAFEENPLPQPDLYAANLSAEDWREALRACKGMMLRQEVVELDIDALERPENPEQLPVKLFSTAYHNCHIRHLQPRDVNRHAVFLVAESEAITYHYELDVRPDIRADQPPTLKADPDPRISHTLNLQYDEYGNVLQSVAVAYPRVRQFQDNSVPADALPLIQGVQKEPHLAYSETHYTNDAESVDAHRLRVPCEVLTYELTGVGPEDASDTLTLDRRDNLYFSIDELRVYRLSERHQDSGTTLELLQYHEQPDRSSNPLPAQKRIVEHVRMLFFDENLREALPLRSLNALGLPYETYKLALTDDLLDAVFTDVKSGKNKLSDLVDGTATARDRLRTANISGYLSGADLITRFGSDAVPVQYWIRSGIAGFTSDAAEHFYLPERYTDPFGNVTILEYDPRDLFVASSTDAMANTTRVTHFDYRVLAPREMQDINNNLSEVFFDVLGLPTAMAVKGKGDEGDNLEGFDNTPANQARTQPNLTDLRAFFDAANLDEVQARNWLGNASARHIYDFGGIEQTLLDGTKVMTWVQHPPCACGLVREQHLSQLAPGTHSPLQAAFEYSDGMGNVIVKKIQAEPEKVNGVAGPLRWVASGKTILNNKGKPVKQYEPYFSKPTIGHRFDAEEAEHEEGVTPVIYYDAVGRTVRTEMPDGSYSRVEFSPWHVRSFDQNDTVKEPDNAWLKNKTAVFATTEEKRTAQLAGEHADTPALTTLDSLGRDVIAVAHNRVRDAAGALKDEKYLTFTKLNAEGKPLWIRDARKNLVMQYIMPPVPNDQATDPVSYAPCYDISGNLLFHHSMDAGDRWMLNDAAGKPMFAWDSRGHTFRTDYDKLHRPTASFVKGADPLDPNRIIQFEKVIYGDTPSNGLPDSPPASDQTRKLNLRGKPYQHFDTAGVITSKGTNAVSGVDEAFDFKGNPLRSTRQLVKDYKNTPDWSKNSALEAEIFTSSTRYDALNRPIQLLAPHSNQPNAKFNVIRPGYNEANLLERMDVWLEQTSEPTVLLNPATANLKAVTNIDYDAKGQRLRIESNEANHPVITEYTYDEETFRLTSLLSSRPKHIEDDQRTLQDLSYNYDPVGNITEIRDKAQQTVFFKNTLIEPSNTYAYDALYRLIHAEGREHAAQNNVQRDARSFEPILGIPFPNSPEALQRYSEDYEYDPVGNILGMHHLGGAVERWVRWYQYALDSNRLLATRSPGEASKLAFYVTNPGYGAKYTYDGHGNMTSMAHLPVMEWDFKNQLRASQQRVVNNGGTGEKTWYVYDASGQRVRKLTETQNGKPKDERIYLGGFEVYRKYNGNGQTITLERETLHIIDDKQRIALIETRTRPLGADPAPRQLVRYQLGNHLGSAALEVDDLAKVISYEEFHPYGTTAYESARSQTDTPKRYRYTGKERDEETGFTYHGARYYAPWLGRWMSADPAGIAAGVNLYLYSAASPLCLMDVDGRQPSPTPHPEDTDIHQVWNETPSTEKNPASKESASIKASGSQADPPQDLPDPRRKGRPKRGTGEMEDQEKDLEDSQEKYRRRKPPLRDDDPEKKLRPIDSGKKTEDRAKQDREREYKGRNPPQTPKTNKGPSDTRSKDPYRTPSPPPKEEPWFPPPGHPDFPKPKPAPSPAPIPQPAPIPVAPPTPTPKPAIEPEKPYFPPPTRNPSGLTAEQIEKLRQSDQPLQQNIITEAPFIAIASVVFLALAPAGAAGALAWGGIRSLAHAP